MRSEERKALREFGPEESEPWDSEEEKKRLRRKPSLRNGTAPILVREGTP